MEPVGLRVEQRAHTLQEIVSRLVGELPHSLVAEDGLEHLLRRAGEVVSKSELLAHVWDEHFDGDPNIVEVYVGRLRRKLDEPFGVATIETVRGAGYRLAAP